MIACWRLERSHRWRLLSRKSGPCSFLAIGYSGAIWTDGDVGHLELEAARGALVGVDHRQ